MLHNGGPLFSKVFVNFLRRGVTFSIGLAGVFGVLFAIVAAVGTWYWSNESSKLAQVAAKQRFEQVAAAVVDKVERAVEPTELLLGLLARDAASQNTGDECNWCSTLAWALAKQPHISSAYVGYPNEDFVRVTRFAESRMRDRARAPASADWGLQAIRTVGGVRTSRWSFYLDNGTPVGTPWSEANPSFKPSTRPWFLVANAAKASAVFTQPFKFNSTDFVGITMVRTLADASTSTAGNVAVAGVSMSLSNWSKSLRDVAVQSGIPRARLAIVNDDRRLLAYSDPKALDTELHTGNAAGASGSAGGEAEIPRIGEVDPAGDVALSTVVPESAMRFQGVLPQPMFGGLFSLKRQFGGPSYAVVIVEERELNRELETLRERATWAAGLAAGVLIPLVAFLGWLIARPMRLLAVQARGIAQLKEPTRRPEKSVVREVRELSHAIHNAQNTVAHFGRFAPIGVVRDIIKRGVAPKLGGKRQSASLLFTDIEGFSLLSEQLSPEDLTQRITEYFSVLAGVLIEHGATIDKYIGDSVMAFWNAPQAQANHPRMAANGVLAARAAINTLNAQWASEGKAILHTRFGLHIGDVVVGNVGSADRMNYTAFGEAVNMASRLEGANKSFGSSILMSEAFALAIGDGFVQRSLGAVVPAGTTHAVAVSELCCEIITSSTAERLRAQGWSPIIAAWSSARNAADFGQVAQMIAAYASADDTDKVAAKMLKRAQAFASGTEVMHPDGALRLGSK